MEIMAGIQNDRPETDGTSIERYLRITGEDDLIVQRSVLGGPHQDVALVLDQHFDLEHAVSATSGQVAPEVCSTHQAMHPLIWARSDALSRVAVGHFPLPNPADQPSICPALLCSAHVWLVVTDPASPQTSQLAPADSACHLHQCQILTAFSMRYLLVLARLLPLFYCLLRGVRLVAAFLWHKPSVPKVRLPSMLTPFCKSSLDDSLFRKIVLSDQPRD
jgi:hypothetical protein